MRGNKTHEVSEILDTCAGVSLILTEWYDVILKTCLLGFFRGMFGRLFDKLVGYDYPVNAAKMWAFKWLVWFGWTKKNWLERDLNQWLNVPVPELYQLSYSALCWQSPYFEYMNYLYLFVTYKYHYWLLRTLGLVDWVKVKR